MTRVGSSEPGPDAARPVRARAQRLVRRLERAGEILTDARHPLLRRLAQEHRAEGRSDGSFMVTTRGRPVAVAEYGSAFRVWPGRGRAGRGG